MIPLILTDTAAVPGAPQLQQGDAGKDDDAVLFADFLVVAGGTTENVLQIRPFLFETKGLTPDVEGVVADGSDPIVTDPDMYPPETGSVSVLSVTAQQTGRAAADAVTSNSRSVAVPLNEGGDSSFPAADLAANNGSKLGTAAPFQTSIAQTLVEGRLPQGWAQPLRAATVQADAARPQLLAGDQGRTALTPPPEGHAGKSAALAGIEPLSNWAKDRPDTAGLPKSPEVVKVSVAEGKLAVPFVPPVAQATQAPVMPPTAPPPAGALANGLSVSQSELPQKLSGAAEQEILPALGVGERGAATVSGGTSALAAAGAETARQVAGQMAMTLPQQSGKITEIALNPEELGRVKLSLSAGDGAIILTIQAERPETGDLLRRHIDVLAQEFRSLGYTSITFSFSADGQAGSSAQAETENEQEFAETGDAASMHMNDPARPRSGLDLRL